MASITSIIVIIVNTKIFSNAKRPSRQKINLKTKNADFLLNTISFISKFSNFEKVQHVYQTRKNYYDEAFLGTLSKKICYTYKVNGKYLLLLKEQLSPWRKDKPNKCPPFDKSFPQKEESVYQHSFFKLHYFSNFSGLISERGLV